jgi:release factor glutamine methyltransferase
MKNVVNNEPAQALFVPDTDPLVFYKAISTFALSNLSEGGKIYFEINEVKGNEVVNLVKEFGAAQVVLKKDMQGKDRMVKGVLAV